MQSADVDAAADPVLVYGPISSKDVCSDRLTCDRLGVQWCQSNFSSIEDIKTRQNRGDFRQKIESIEEMQQFHAPLKWAFLG
jgi:hypothetical protein